MANFFDKFRQQVSSKKTIPVIMVVDASGSMSGDRMRYVNNAIKTVANRFADYNKNVNNEYIIRMAVLKFASGAQWITDGLVDPIEYEIPAIHSGGLTDLGSALSELNDKFSRNCFFSSSSSWASPTICFISDGMPTDNYEFALGRLNENNWYKTSNKTAIAIGEEADCVALGKVVGNHDAVVLLNSVTFLEQMMVGIAASLVALPVSITSTALPVRPISKTRTDEFDSDRICCSRIASMSPNFDSDRVCETCVLKGDSQNDFDSDEITATLSSWSDSDWDESSKSPVSVAPDVSAERRRKLAEALRNGSPIVVTPNGEISGGQHDSSVSAIKVPDGKLAGGGVCCTTCNNFVATGFKFCPHCGTPVSVVTPHKVSVNQVQFSAVVPKRFIKGEYAMVEMSVYEETYRHIIDRIIANADDDVREVVASSQEVADKTRIRIALSSPDIKVSDCEEVQEWHGKYLTFSFPVEVPGDYVKKQILFVASVYFNDLIATKLKFVANCISVKEQKIQMTREDVLTAFVSYASQDRSRVATIIQGMKKARPEMDIFFDVESLRSGEDWELALRREIEKRDILFLCWSNFAKQSEWVEKEWRYALANKGIDSIEPIPLVSPTECPPPEELRAKHFNDRALLYKGL